MCELKTKVAYNRILTILTSVAVSAKRGIYLSKKEHRAHLRHIHKMKLPPSSRSPHDPNFLPDPLDLKFYCRVCKSTKVALAK